MISIYLYDSDGMSERKIELLTVAAQLASRLGLSYVTQGDVNMTLDELFQDLPGYLIGIGGVIRAPNISTIKSTLGGRVIGFMAFGSAYRPRCHNDRN